MITIDAVILGGGRGTRFSQNASAFPGLPKQFQLIGNLPVFAHAVRSLLSLDCFRSVVLVFPKVYLPIAQAQIKEYLPEAEEKIRMVEGGERRQDSSYAGLAALESEEAAPTRVLIHDACRPYLSRPLLSRIHKSLLDRSYGAWIPVVPSVETLKKVENLQVVETIDRSAIQRVQTPQIFEYSVIRSLAEKARANSELNFTDDASLCEYYGIPVGVFEGDVRNIKLTYDFEKEALRHMIESEHQRGETCASDSATTFTV